MGRFDWFTNAFGRGGRGVTGGVSDLPVGPVRKGVSNTDITPITDIELRNAPQVKDANAVQGTPEAQNLAKQKNVQDAAKTKKDDLAKLGLQGAAGVAALMILTGESNPISAVEAAVDGASKAAKTARDAAGGGLNIINQLIDFFTNFGLYICLCCCCIIFLIAIFMIL